MRRVREAGAIVVGKTTTHEFAWGMSMAGCGGRDADAQPARPRAVDRAAPAAGRRWRWRPGSVPLALGTDTGGSIRLPAGWCGIYGFKPTHGLLSVEGVWPLAPSLDHVGPMAATARDCSLLFEVLGGPRLTAADAREPRVAGSDVLPDGAVGADVYRVLMLSEALPDPPRRRALARARRRVHARRPRALRAGRDRHRRRARLGARRARRDARPHGRRLRRVRPRPLARRRHRPAAHRRRRRPARRRRRPRRPPGPARPARRSRCPTAPSSPGRAAPTAGSSPQPAD